MPKFISSLLAKVKAFLANPLATLDQVVSLLPKPVQPLVKAVVAAVVPLVTVAVVNGSFDYKAIVAAALSAVAVYLVPNHAAAKPAAAKAKRSK